MLRKCKACYSLNWFKPLMEVSTVHSMRIPHFPQNSEENLSLQNSAEFRGVDKIPRRKPCTIATAELALTVKLYWFYWSAEEL